MASLDLDLNLQHEILNALTSLSKVEKTWIDSPAAVALVAGLLALMGSLLTHWFNSNSEKSRRDHESDIRKQENIQEKQLEALVQLSTITYEVTPTIWSHPDYESHDAYTEVVHSMGGLLNTLDEFLKTKSYILPQDVILNLNEVMFKCNDKHWGASLSEEPGYEPTSAEIEAAEEVIDKLQLAVNAFKLKLGVVSA